MLIVTVFVIGFSVGFADVQGGRMGNLTPSLDYRRNVLLGRTYDLSDHVLVKTAPAPEILAAHYRATCESGKGCDESLIAVGSPFWCQHATPLQLHERSFRNANLIGSTVCQANLAFANLYGADLVAAKLYGAHLFGAQLRGADLRDAKLHGADLAFADLCVANLWETKLYGANLWRAKLYDALLLGAELHGANLQDAQLHKASLKGAKLYGANLAVAQLHGADLRKARLDGASNQLRDLRDFPEPFEAVINERIDKESDLSGTIFAGGLSREDVDSIGQCLSDGEEIKELEAHIGLPKSHELPDDSGARIGAYTKEDSARWIAEYQTARAGGG